MKPEGMSSQTPPQNARQTEKERAVTNACVFLLLQSEVHRQQQKTIDVHSGTILFSLERGGNSTLGKDKLFQKIPERTERLDFWGWSLQGQFLCSNIYVYDMTKQLYDNISFFFFCLLLLRRTKICIHMLRNKISKKSSLYYCFSLVCGCDQIKGHNKLNCLTLIYNFDLPERVWRLFSRT